jgi:tape measure domain-containing protein
VRDIAVGWVGSLLQQSAQVERLTILMKGLSTATTEVGRSQEATQNLQMLFQMARDTGFAVDALADAFVKLKSGGLDPTDGSLRSLADAVAYFGGTSDVMHRASIAIQQMAGKGVISMEELRQQLGEAVPTAMADMARAAGMALPEFTKLVSKGIVQAEPALKLMFMEFERLYAGAGDRMANTLTGQLAQFKTNVMELSTYFTGLAQGNSAAWQAYLAEQQKLLDEGKITVEEFDRLTKQDGGLFQGATDALKQINEAMQSNAGREFATEIGASVNQMTASFMQFAASASGSGGAVVGVFRAIADAVSMTFNILTIVSDAFKSLGAFGGAALKALVVGFIALKTANVFSWLWSSIGATMAGFRNMSLSAATASTAIGQSFNQWSVAATNQATILRNQIALQNGRTRYLLDQAAAARVAATTTQNLALSLRAQENVLRAKVATELAAVQAARQAQVVAAANISTGVRLSA